MLLTAHLARAAGAGALALAALLSPAATSIAHADAPAPITASVADASTNEGTRAARTLRFAVTLSDTSEDPVSVRLETIAGTASIPGDVAAADEVLTFEPGDRRKVVEVTTTPDAAAEPDETFTVELSEATGAGIARGTATGTVRDDDAALGPGDLQSLACVTGSLASGTCAAQVLGLDTPTLTTAVGARDTYLASSTHVTLVQRDPKTQRVTSPACFTLVHDDSGCDELALPGGKMVRGARITDVAATADGSTLFVLTDFSNIGEDGGLLVLHRSAADGDLSLTGCAGSSLQHATGSPCLRLDGNLPSGVQQVVVSPDGRDAYLLGGHLSGKIVAIRMDGEQPQGASCFGAGSDCAAIDVPSSAELRGAISPDGTRLLLRVPGEVRSLRRTTDGGLTVDATRTVAGSGAVTFSADGAQAYVASSDDDAIHWMNATTLQGDGCIADASSAATGCATAPFLGDLRGLKVAPDGQDLYAATAGGGTIALHRAANGALHGGRCLDPESEIPTCGSADSSVGAGSFQITPSIDSGIAISSDGALVTTVDGAETAQLALRVASAPSGDTNRAPVCAGAAAQGRPGRALTLVLRCVDPDGDAVHVAITHGPANGTVDAPGADGTAIYHPAAGFRGTDELRYTATDARGASSAEVTAAITIANALPTCTDASSAANEGATQTVTVSCTDPEGEALHYEVVDGPSAGRASDFEGATLTWTPPAGFTGTASLRFRATDGDDASEIRTATFYTVLHRDKPSCHFIGQGINEVVLNSAPKGGVATSPLDCRDPDGGPVTVSVVKQVVYGTMSVTNASMSYRGGTRVGSGVVTLRATDDEGDTTDFGVGVRTGEYAPTCDNACKADKNGTISVDYYCHASSSTTPGGPKCTGQVVVVICNLRGCQTFPTDARPDLGTQTAAAARAGTGGKASAANPFAKVKGTRAAQQSISLTPGTPLSLRLNPSKAVRKLLKKKGKLRAVLLLDVTRPDGGHDRLRKLVTLRAPS
jgi:hypothetical protein